MLGSLGGAGGGGAAHGRARAGADLEGKPKDSIEELENLLADLDVRNRELQSKKSQRKDGSGSRRAILARRGGPGYETQTPTSPTYPSPRTISVDSILGALQLDKEEPAEARKVLPMLGRSGSHTGLMPSPKGNPPPLTSPKSSVNQLSRTNSQPITKPEAQSPPPTQRSARPPSMTVEERSQEIYRRLSIEASDDASPLSRKMVEFVRAKRRLMLALKETMAIGPSAPVVPIKNGEHLKLGAQQVGQALLIALYEGDYEQFAYCLHVLCKVAVTAYKQAASDHHRTLLLWEMTKAAQASIDLISLLMDAEDETARMEAIPPFGDPEHDPLMIALQHAHGALSAPALMRTESHVEQLVALMGQALDTSPSTPTTPTSMAAAGVSAHYHMAFFLGIEGMRGHRKRMMELLVLMRSVDVPSIKDMQELSLISKQLVAMVRGIVEMMKVPEEQQFSFARNLKNEIMNKLKIFADAVVKVKTPPSTLPETLDHVHAQVMASIDHLLHDVYEARNVMLDLDVPQGQLVEAQTEANNHVVVGYPPHHVDVNELAVLLADHVRKLSTFIGYSVAALMTQEKATLLAEGPAMCRMHLCGIVQCAILLARRSSSGTDPAFQNVITAHAEKLITHGFEIPVLFMQILERKQKAIMESKEEATLLGHLHPHGPVAVNYDTGGWSEHVDEKLKEATAEIKANISQILSILKSHKGSMHQSSEDIKPVPVSSAVPSGAVQPQVPIDLAKLKVTIKGIVEVVRMMLDICKNDDDEPHEGREEALINGYVKKLAENLSALVEPIDDVEEKRGLLRQAFAVEENIRRFRREKTRGELSPLAEEQQYHQVVVPSVQLFLSSAKQSYTRLREVAV